MPHPSKSNVSTEKNPKNHGGKGADGDEIGPSHNLWVGNLSNDTTDTDLMDAFEKYGALDSVTTYSSRNFAFIYFKRLEDARAAKDALQGTVLLGNPIKIEFARPARPGKHLWVGGISSSVTKEQLEDEFSKFGKIEEFKFLRDRNSALVDYHRLEDAAVALKNMNGKRLGGEQMRVDYLRSQPSRRDNRSDFPDSRDRRSMGPPESLLMSDGMRNHPESSQFGSKRNLPSQHPGGRRGQPSNVLWIGYPPTIQIDEQMLHNAMILFGEIERIKSFPSRNYSFVEFRSVDEARRAKEGLQGRLFNDPRIQILFSSSGLAPGKDSPGLYPGIKGPRPDMFFSEPMFVPGSMDFYGQNRPMAPNNFLGPLASKGMPGPNMLMRSFGPQGAFDPLLSAAPELFNDLAGLLHNFADGNNPTGPNWRRLSPSGPGMLPSPVTGRPGIRPSGPWDGSDMNPFPRESKRSRIDGPSPLDDPSLGRRINNQGIVTQQDRGILGPFANAQDLSRQSPGMRGPSGGPPGLPENEICWRGVIAKGGTPVCHARCVPIGKGIDSQLPEIVNCSARTGLDMLTKHYAEASGFDIVYFLPDSEDDFASYTEFLRYLGAKNRAGVAKFDDGTTLFLVPPSDFLTKVLNINGPERLYGVVLKLPQQMPSSAPMQQHSQQLIPPSPYVNRHQLLPLQNDYNVPPQKEDQVFQTDYNRLPHEDSTYHPPKQVLQHTGESPSVHSASQDYASNTTSVPQAGVSLTPELIATLASLLPANMQSSVTTSAQLPIGSSAPRPTSFPSSSTMDNSISSQGWRQDPANAASSLHHSREEQTVHQSQPLGHQFGNQPPYLSQYPAYGNVTSGPENPAQAMHGSTQIQDSTLKIPQQGAVSSRTSSNFANPSQGAHFVPQQVNQHFQFDTSHNSQRSYGSSQATEATGQFRSPAFEQPKPPVSSTQVQQLQTALSSAGQGSVDGDADKNQRYQSTLQFAANLLLQIQQQQQQGNTQAAQGPGNPQ